MVGCEDDLPVLQICSFIYLDAKACCAMSPSLPERARDAAHRREATRQRTFSRSTSTDKVGDLIYDEYSAERPVHDRAHRRRRAPGHRQKLLLLPAVSRALPRAPLCVLRFDAHRLLAVRATVPRGPVDRGEGDRDHRHPDGFLRGHRAGQPADLSRRHPQFDRERARELPRVDRAPA